jgi:dihydrofolate synthase / folylpolyglutamate synthase
MLLTIEETLNWIQQHLPHGIKPGLARMEWVMEKLDHPERHIRAIHVGGTNGKGSTVSFLRGILMQQFEDVGTFTSPYIVDFKERIAVNGLPITDEELVQAANIIYPLAKELGETDLGTPTEFEVITMISFAYFSRIHPCDVVIYEVGLGGRLDSTNILTPLISVITNVGMDHVQYLGETIPQIAMEKAGIIKPGVPVVTTAEHPEALQVIQEKAREQKAKLYVYGKDFTGRSTQGNDQFEHFDFKSLFWDYKGLKSGLRGPHQVKNASAALMALNVLSTYFAFPIDKEAVYSGLELVSWPGRFEVVSEKPLIILDGAHNEDGVRALVETIVRDYSTKHIKLLFATLKDRNNAVILDLLQSLTNDLTLTTFDYARAEDPDKLIKEKGSLKIEKNWQKAFQDLITNMNEDDVLLITGSLYFISEVRNALQAQNSLF